MDSNKKAVKSGIAYTVASFMQTGISFLMTPIFTRMLTKNEYGIYSNYTSWMGILTVIITLKLDASVISARYDFKDEYNNYIFSMMSLTAVTIGIFGLIVNVFSTYFVRLFDLDLWMLNVMFVYIFFCSCCELHLGKQRFYYRYNQVVFTNLFITIGSSILSLLLVSFCTNRLSGRIIGAESMTILVGSVIFVYYLIQNKTPKLKHWLYALPITLPFIPHGLSLMVLNSMDRVMITKINGAEATALYSLAYTCSSVVTILMSSMNNAYGPWLAEKLNVEDYVAIRKFSYVYVGIFMCLVVGIMLIAPEALLILGGNGYLESKYVMPPVMFGCAIQLLYTMHVNIEQIKKKTFGMAVATVMAAISNYILNAICIPRFGYIAAAYTTLASYLFLLVLHMFLVRRMKLGRIYDNKFILGVIVVGLLVTGGINFIYHFDLIRYTLLVLYIVFFCILLFINRINIVDFIKKK